MFCFDFWLADLFWNGHMNYLCGAVWRWSILAMHPILRIFVYHNHGSLRLSGSCAPHAQGGVGREPVRSATICHMNLVWSLPCVTNCYHDTHHPVLCFRAITNAYHARRPNQIPRVVDMCGRLPNLTRHYHRSDLGLPRPCVTFTNTPPPLDDITHSTDTMCYVGLLWLYWCGDDRHLYDVGVLFVWLDTGVYECLGVSDGVEMARVLC